MADMNGVPEVEMLDYGSDVGGVVVHVVTITDLNRPARGRVGRGR
jgi:hypothetical protein